MEVNNNKDTALLYTANDDKLVLIAEELRIATIALVMEQLMWKMY